jgi:hypothetical protein
MMKFLLLLLSVYIPSSTAFLLPHSCHRQAFSSPHKTLSSLHAKKKSRGDSGSKGFGKTDTPTKKAEPSVESTPTPSFGEEQQQTPDSPSFLRSVESGGSDAVPIMMEVKQTDDNSSPEERGERILREKYGLKTMGEQRVNAKQQEALKEKRQKMAEWSKMADKGDDFDLMTSIPAPILIGIDRFLKAGIVICGTLFILAGLGITAEAWSKTEIGNPLPDDIDNFIVQIVEPNFTYGLLVLLGFSVSLGLFGAAQLGSQGATYREE